MWILRMFFWKQVKNGITAENPIHETLNTDSLIESLILAIQQKYPQLTNGTDTSALETIIVDEISNHFKLKDRKQ